MNCRSVQANLSAFVDREVAPDELGLIRAHLAECEECRAEERDLRCLKALLNDIDAPEPRPGFEARLLSSIHVPRQKSSLWTGGRSALLFAFVAAASMMVTLQYVAGSRVITRQDSSSQDVSADVRRDQVYEASLAEPLFGAPVVTTAGYGR